LAITGLRFTDRFQREYKSLSVELKQAVDETIRDLNKDPIPTVRRFHSLKGFKNPKLYTVDVTSNKAYKISLAIDGETATLRRIATHKEIDRAP
jgi:mRNA-degrading endonuclease RelE of RelBE toxin-antitoxin system